MALTLDPEIRERIELLLKKFDRVAGNGDVFTNHPALLEVRNELGYLLDDWARRRLGNTFRDQVDLQLFTRTLADIHKEISGADRVNVRANNRNVVMKVEGCPRYLGCSTKSSITWCLSNMVVAAIIQRAMQTPVITQIHLSGGKCVHEHRPAWLAELVSELDQFGAEGMAVLYGDRMLFSHLPSDKHAEALSEGLMLHEESGANLPARDIFWGDRKIMLLRFGKIFVSICLKKEGADEDGIRGHVESALRTAELL